MIRGGGGKSVEIGRIEKSGTICIKYKNEDKWLVATTLIMNKIFFYEKRIDEVNGTIRNRGGEKK